MAAILEHVLATLNRGPLGRRLTVRGGMVGAWDVEVVCEALLHLQQQGAIGGFDGEAAAERGEGSIFLYAA